MIFMNFMRTEFSWLICVFGLLAFCAQESDVDRNGCTVWHMLSAQAQFLSLSLLQELEFDSYRSEPPWMVACSSLLALTLSLTLSSHHSVHSKGALQGPPRLPPRLFPELPPNLHLCVSPHPNQFPSRSVGAQGEKTAFLTSRNVDACMERIGGDTEFRFTVKQ